MQTRTNRWQSVQWVVILISVFLVGELVYFWSIQNDVPPHIDDVPQDVKIEFTVDKSTVLTLENCVQGRWSVDGSDEIRVNGGDWTDQARGQYTLCNQPNLSPTLEVRLPSSAIASYTLDVKVIFSNGLQSLAGFVLVCLFMWVWGVQLWSHRRLLLLVISVHIGLAIIYQLTTHLSITNAWHWDTLVHTIDMEDLRYNLLESFIYLHAQPPLFTVYGVTIDILFGDYRAEAMYLIQTLLGALMCGMSYVTLAHYTRNKTVSLFVALTLALNPAYFLFEALILYTIHSAFLVLSAGFCLVLYQRTTLNRYLYLFVLCINLLVLIRSVYHIAFLIPILILVAILAQHNLRRVMLGCVMICMLSVGWYGKNWLVFDSFTSSTWFGMSLWKVARDDYSDGELQALLDLDVLTDNSVIWFRPFMLPSAYREFDPVESDIHILNNDDLYNIGYPKINLFYRENALRLIQHDFGRYLNSVGRAYGYYSCASSTYELMEDNIDTFPASHQDANVELFHMRGLILEIARRLGLSEEEYGACSNLYVLMPIMMLGYPLFLILRCHINLKRWRDIIRRDSFLIYTWGIVTFTTVTTSFLEIPENARFKFMIEVPMFIFMAVISYRVIMVFRHRLKDRVD